MHKLFLPYILCILSSLPYQTKANICQWSGPAMGNWNNPANWSCGQVPGASDTVRLIGHSVVLDDTVSIRALILSQNCTIGGSGMLSISGKMDVNAGGNHIFLPKIVVNGSAETNMATLNFNARAFVLNGSGHFIKGVFWMKDGGTFEVAPTGVATFQDNTNFYSFTSYFGFVVRGTLFKTGAGNMDFESLYRFNKANINIQTGYLVNYYFQSPFNCIIDSSVVNIAAGASLRVERILDISNSTLTGAGKIWIGVGNCRFVHPNTILVDIEQTSGTCSSANGVDTLANYTLLGGSLNPGLQIRGNFNWVKGNLNTVLVQGFTTISDTTVASTNQKNLLGTLTVQGGGKYMGNDQLSGTISIPANAIFSLDANPAANFKADLNISGTFRKLNPNAVTVGFVINNGRLEGIGTLDGTVVGAGTVTPGIGTNTGTLTMNGSNLLLQAQSKIEIQISQAGAAVSSDLLNLLGNFNLSGTLNVMESGSAPAGDYVVIQASGSLNGSFAQANLPPSWELVQNPSNIVLRKLPTPPNAFFSLQNGVLCVPATLHFTDASTGSSLSYQWAFPGGTPNTSTAQNPVVEYSQPGQYMATLTVSNTLGTSTFPTDFSVSATSATSLDASLCAGDTIDFYGIPLSIPGIYQFALLNAAGCDSIVTLHLSQATVDLSVSQNDISLSAQAANASFQWLDCEDFSPIAGATNATFTPTESGNYSVLVTQNGCSDTSACFPILVVGTTDLSNPRANIRVTPNPAKDRIQIHWEAEGGTANPDVVLVYDLHGGLKARFADLDWAQHSLRLDLGDLAAGGYFLVLERDGVRLGGIGVVIGE